MCAVEIGSILNLKLQCIAGEEKVFVTEHSTFPQESVGEIILFYKSVHFCPSYDKTSSVLFF